MHSPPNPWLLPHFVFRLRQRPQVLCLCRARNVVQTEILPTPPTSPRCQIERPKTLVMLFAKLVTVKLTPTSRLGRVLALMRQTYHLFPKIGQRVLMIGIVARLHAETMIAIVLLTVELVTLLTKRGRNLAHTLCRHAMTCVTVLTTGTNVKTTQVATAMTGLRQGQQDYLLRTSLWNARAQATGSPIPQTLVASMLVTVTSHPLETTALAVFHGGVITLIMIL
ncbi:hypothetical protein EI94DRAFT_1728876 [Lactarius quietus]|nr:hypothetical protein EI94DRAFT_1728876 [Lactarius quietus]